MSATKLIDGAAEHGEPRVALGDRIDEMSALQRWMDWMPTTKLQEPALVRAQVLT